MEAARAGRYGAPGIVSDADEFEADWRHAQARYDELSGRTAHLEDGWPV